MARTTQTLKRSVSRISDHSIAERVVIGVLGQAWNGTDRQVMVRPGANSGIPPFRSKVESTVTAAAVPAGTPVSVRIRRGNPAVIAIGTANMGRVGYQSLVTPGYESRLVSSLPSLPDDTNYPAGSVVVKSDDGKTYRTADGINWLSSVDVTDVDGLDTGSIPPDGATPGSSPTPTVVGGVGFLAASWLPVTNADQVTYEVHLSTTTGFTPSGGTKYGETIGNSIIIKTLVGGGALSYSTTYYVKLIAKDDDGSAAAGSQGSAQLVAATSGDISVSSLSSLTANMGTLTAGSITGGHITADIIDSGTLSATRIATRSLTVDKLSIGSFDNLVGNAGFEIGAASDWTLPGSGSIGTATPRSGTYELTMTGTGTATSNRIYCAQGDYLYAEAYVAKDAAGGTTTARISIAWYNSSGSLISRTSGTTTTVVMSGGGGVLYTQLTVGGTGSNAVAPALTTWAQIELECVAFGGAGTTKVFFDDVYSRRTLTGNIIVDGTIDTTQLHANAVTTTKLAVTATVGYVDNSIGGTVTYGVTIDPTGITIKDQGGTSVLTGAGFGGSWVSYVDSHVYNGNFDSGPTGGNGTVITGVNATNSLPSWTLVVVGGTRSEISWRNDAAVGRLGQVRFKLLNAGSASDDSYIYQDIPINPRSNYTRGTHIVSVDGLFTTGLTNCQLYVKARYLNSAKTGVGTETTVQDSATFPEYCIPNGGLLTSDAAYVRVKVGIRRNTASTSGTAQAELYAVNVNFSASPLLWGSSGQMGVLTTLGAGGVAGDVWLGLWDPSTAGSYPYGIGIDNSSPNLSFQGVSEFFDNVTFDGAITHAGAYTNNDGGALGVNRTTGNALVASMYNTTDSVGTVLLMRKSGNGSLGNLTTAVAVGETLGAIVAQGTVSSAYENAARIVFMADSGGTISAGRVDGLLSFQTALAGTMTEQMTINRNGSITLSAGNNINTNTTTGTIIAVTAGQKLGFWGATAVAQSALNPTGKGSTGAGVGAAARVDTTYAGGLGGNAYTVGDIVFALKTAGLLP